MKQLIAILMAAIAGVFFNSINAQTVEATVTLDTNAILVGDHVNLKLNLVIPENYAFAWPVFADSIAHNIEILRQSKIDTTRINGLMNIAQTLTLTSFDSGYYVIPPIKFGYGSNKNVIDNFVESDPHLLNVFTIPVDTQQSFKPIKGPMKAPYTFAELLPWILITLAAAAAIFAGYYFWKKKKQQVPLFISKPKPSKPPHQIALDALDELKKQKLWQQGRVKEYYTVLTEIVREYIEKRFSILAIEMTTYEILSSFNSTKLEKGLKADLQNMLQLADLVKFAKANPLPTEHDQSMTMAENFVLHTIPPRIPEPTLTQEITSNTEDTAVTPQSLAKK